MLSSFSSDIEHKHEVAYVLVTLQYYYIAWQKDFLANLGAFHHHTGVW